VAVKAVPLSTYTGAEIIDADPVLLRDALTQYHVLAFHDQRFTPASAGNAVAAFDAAEISLSLSMAR